MPMSRIVIAIDGAVGHWLDPAYPLRQEAESLLPDITGYSPQMIHIGLPALLKPFQKSGIQAILSSEFGSIDGLPPCTTGAEAPVTPRLITHVLAGTIPSIGPETIIRALLLRSASIVRTSRGDPLTAAFFAQSLAEADKEVGACVAVLWWESLAQKLTRQVFAASDAVIAYGGATAVEGLRALAPPEVLFIEHGHRISFALIGREALTDGALRGLAESAAWDVCFFDQQGCVSPHAIFVERGGEMAPMNFARALGEAMAVLEGRLPRGRVSDEERSTIQQLRGAWELRRAAGHSTALLQSAGSTAWTVLYEEDAPLTPTCLNRVVRVIAVDSLNGVPLAASHLRPHLQTAGTAGDPQRLARLAPALTEAGVTRLCAIGQMQHPPADWLHDGRHPLRELVRWPASCT